MRRRSPPATPPEVLSSTGFEPGGVGEACLEAAFLAQIGEPGRGAAPPQRQHQVAARALHDHNFMMEARIARCPAPGLAGSAAIASGGLSAWGDRMLPWLFAALAGPLCLFLALTVPPGQVPDEGAHALRADSLTHFALFGRRAGGSGPGQGGVTAREAMLHITEALPEVRLPERHLTLQRERELQHMPWGREAQFVPAPNTAVYLPVFYVPAALGIAVERAAGKGPLQALLAARVMNAVAYLALGCVALAIARGANALLFAVLTLPMTLWLAGSVNEDGLLIATAALAAAALTRLREDRRWPLWVAGIATALIAATKPCYLPLGLAMLADVRAWELDWREARRRCLRVALVVLPGLAWAAAMAAFVAVPFDRPAYAPGPLWPGDPARVFHATDPGAQALVLLHRPMAAVSLLADWAVHSGTGTLLEAVGVLGLLDVALPHGVYVAWFAALGVAALAALFVPGRASVTATGAAALWLAVLASAAAVCLLQYLSWTRVGATLIEGVQGRYFLPLLPFAGVALTAASLSDRPRVRILLTVPPVLLASSNVVLLGRLVMTTYALR